MLIKFIRRLGRSGHCVFKTMSAAHYRSSEEQVVVIQRAKTGPKWQEDARVTKNFICYLQKDEGGAKMSRGLAVSDNRC
jgi:hypothetical protein